MIALLQLIISIQQRMAIRREYEHMIKYKTDYLDV